MIALLYLLFAAASAFVEAVLYARRGADAFTFNEHIVMALQRAAVALLPSATLVLVRWCGAPWYVAAELVPALLLFPLVHDEVYNFTRLWLTESEKSATAAGAVYGPLPLPTSAWWLIRLLPSSMDSVAFVRAWIAYRYGYQSPTTTARNDFNGRQRTWLAILGLVAWASAAYFLL